MSTTEDRASGELREGYAEIGDQRLHYMEAGDGPLIVLLGEPLASWVLDPDLDKYASTVLDSITGNWP